MIKKILGIAPKLEDDGSCSPSKVALRLAVSAKTDFVQVSYEKYQGQKSKILVICSEQKDMQMENGKKFSTGNQPVEAILHMLHLWDAGFEFNIVTPSGKLVVFEMWAMPSEDQNVMSFYNVYKKCRMKVIINFQ